MLQKSTLTFLRSLRKNNNRGWFAKNKSLYEDARYDFEILTSTLIGEISKFDSSVSGLDPGDCLFRIYRDIRFSKDKTPYKTNFAADITRGGRKSGNAGYYFHLEPGNKSMLAGGLYMPPPDKLRAVRTAILNRYDKFAGITGTKDFKKYFGGLWEDKLKIVPKGFPKDHSASGYLKYRSFIVVHELTDKQALSPSVAVFSSRIFKSMKPLIDFLNQADNPL